MDASLEQARSLFVEGIEHFEGGRLDAARERFAAALALAPGRPSVLGNLGITLFRLGRMDEAVAALEAAVAGDADYDDAWFALGGARHALGHWAAAAQALGEGLARNPQRVEPCVLHAECLHREGDLPAALAAYERALALDPALAAAWTERGSILRELQRFDEAAASFEKALALGGDAELNAFYLAAVREAAGQAAPLPRRYVETLFDAYAEDFEDHLVGQLRYQGFETLLRPLLDEAAPGEVLDLGCGTGLCGRQLQGVATAVDGVDVSAEMIARARGSGHYRELWHGELAEHLEASACRYDTVLAADVFVYVGELATVFAGVRRILRPGGRFAFTVEAGEAGSGVRLLPKLRYTHAPDYLRSLAEAHGFTVSAMYSAPIRYDQDRPVPGLYVHLR